MTDARHWPENHSSKLQELCTIPPMISAEAMASAINAEFGTEYSRLAVIGRVKRMGLKLGPHGVNYIPRVHSPSIEAVAEEAEPLHVGLSDLGANECRYPYGDGPFTFCGCSTGDGMPYCFPHMQLTHRPALEGAALERVKRLYRARAA